MGGVTIRGLAAGAGPFGLTEAEVRRLAEAGIVEISADQLADLREQWRLLDTEARARAGGAPDCPPARRRRRMPDGRDPAAGYYPSEHAEQSAFFARVRWFAATYPDRYPDLLAIFAIPNGDARPAAEAADGTRYSAAGARIKAEGGEPGVPDICIPVPRGTFPGAFLETKRRRGAPSRIDPDQVVWLDRLAGLGWFVRVCYGEAELWRTATEYLGYSDLVHIFTNPGSGVADGDGGTP